MSHYKDEFQDWVEAHVDPATLRRTDGSRAKRVITYAYPDQVLLSKYFEEDEVDIIFTVRRVRSEPNRHVQLVPKRYHVTFELGVFTINNSVVDGEVLRDLGVLAVESAFEASPTDTSPYREFWIQNSSDEDRYRAGHMIFNTNFIVIYKVHRT